MTEPTYDDQAERYLIGAVLAGFPDVDELTVRVQPEDFYGIAHEQMWAAITRLHQEGTPPEPVAVRNALAVAQAGLAPAARTNPMTLVEYSQAVPMPAQAPYYAEQVALAAGLRRIQQAGTKVQQIGTTVTDLATAREDARAAIDEATQGRDMRARRTFYDVYGTVLDVAENGRGPTIDTPWRELDRLIGGLAPGRFIVFGARPGVGKSLVGTNLALHMAYEHKHQVLICSMEMSEDEVGQRLLSAHASVDIGDLQEGRTSQRDWAKIQATDTLSLADLITIDDTAEQTLAHVRRVARDIKRKRNDLALIVVDYLQLMKASSSGPRDRNRVGELTEISRGLKILGRELDVCVVAMAQLNREAAKHADGRPQLTDLRESGSIENDANQVILMHLDEDNADLVMDVAKNRHGKRGDVRLARRYHFSQIVNSEWSP